MCFWFLHELAWLMYRVLNVPSVSRIERRFLSVACPFLLVWPGTQHILLGTFHGGGKSVCGRNYTLWSDSYLCQINRAKHVLNKNLLNVIEALVFSKLYYRSSLWSNTSCSNISRLQRSPGLCSTSTKQQREIRPHHPDIKGTTLVSCQVT